MKHGPHRPSAMRAMLFSLSAASRLSGQVPDLYAGADLKVFWFFSSEKNILPNYSDRNEILPPAAEFLDFCAGAAWR
jgi:hypothetical protein